jgi:hypothetical protein
MLSSFLSSFLFCITVESSHLYNSFSFSFYFVVVVVLFLSFFRYFFILFVVVFHWEVVYASLSWNWKEPTLFIFKSVSTFYNSIIYLYLPSKTRIRSNL